MDNQKVNPKSIEHSGKREKVSFDVGGAGGIIVIGVAVVAAAIGAAFVAYRDKRCRKQGGDRPSQNGVDEKPEKDLLDLGKSEGSSDNLVIHENVNQNHETTEDDFEHKDEERVEDGSEETGDSSTELNIEAIRFSEMIDQKKSRIEEEFAFGSLIEIQETNPDMTKEENQRKISYNSSTIAVEMVEKTEEMCTMDAENNAAYDFSFWNNKLNKHKEIEDVSKEASGKSEGRSDDVFELEDEEYTSFKQRNGNTFVVTLENSESENYKQRVENMQTEKELGEENGGAFAYVGVEAEQKSQGNGKLVEEEANKKTNDTANVVNGEENEKGGDTQSPLKEPDEKDEGKEEEQGNITYVEVAGKMVEKGENISTHNEQRKRDDNRENEENSGVHLSMKLVEEQEKAGDVSLIEVREENCSQEDIGFVLEKDNKVREEEVHNDITHRKVEEIAVEEEERDEVRHVEEEITVMENDNQSKYKDDIEVEIVVEEKEDNKGQKGADDKVNRSEEKGEYITVKDESYEEMKTVKVVEKDENSENLLLVEKTEDTDVFALIEAGNVKDKNEEVNEIIVIEHGIVDAKSGGKVEIEKDKEGDGIVCVGIEVEEQNTEGDIACTEVHIRNKADDIYSVVHGQENRKDEDDVEIISEIGTVDKEVVNNELKEVEENVEMIGVAEETLHDVVNKEIKDENKDNINLKEMKNDVDEDGIELQLVEEQKSRDIALSDEVNKEFINFTQEKDKKAEEEEGKEQDDSVHAEVEVSVEKGHEDTPHVEGRKEIEEEKEDEYGDDGNTNVEMKLVEGYDIINTINRPKEEEIKENETANTELNEEAKKGDMAQEEINTLEEIQKKNSDEKFSDKNEKFSSDSFAAFQNEDNMEKEVEGSKGQTENGMNQPFADHSSTGNDNAKEGADCLVLEKEKTYMFIDHISKRLFLLVLAMSIAIGILSIFAHQDLLRYYNDHHLPRLRGEIFRFFLPTINQTAKTQ